MARPGVEVTLLDTPGAVSIASDTGTWFITGLTDRGPAASPQQIISINDFIATFGNRQTYSPLYDVLDLFFREGGNQAYVSRVVGPGATIGTKTLLDAVASVSLIVNANGPGAWSANYKIGVVSGVTAGTYNLNVYATDGITILETSGDLPDQQSAVDWSKGSNYVRVVLGVSTQNPANVAPAALSAGTDDRNNVTDTQWQTAQDTFTMDFGPGQVSQPGRTSTTAFSQLTAHAANNKRVAVLDLANTATVSTLTAAAASAPSRFAAAFAPWIVVPGLVANTFRTVPPSGLIAGLIARNDPVLGVNHPSAGNAGQSYFAVGLSQPPWIDSDRQTLNQGGVNVVRPMFGGVRVYGWRSLTNPNTDQNWIDFANARLYMSMCADLGEVGENYMFEEIDGQNGQTVNGLHDGLAGVMMGYFNTGQLFGDSADQTFFVDTGATVNTLQTLANLELHAIVYVKMAPFAEWIPIQVVKRQVTQTIT
jgi:hypothetical protein